MRTTVGPSCPRHWRIHPPPAADVDQPREVAWVASVDDWGGGLCRGERDDVPPQRELVVAHPGALGRDGDRLQRVVIRHHVRQRRRLPGQLEGVEDVGQAVAGYDRWTVRHLEVQMRPARRARAPHLRDLLPTRDPIAGLHRDAARLQVRIDRKPPLTEIEHDAVAAGGVRRHVLPRLAHQQVRVAIDRFHDGSVGHRQHGLAKGGKAGGEGRIADAGPVLGIQLVEVDGEALRQIPPAVDRLQRAAMRSVATTPERGPPCPYQRSAEHHRRPPINRYRRGRVRQPGVGNGHVGRRIDGQPVRDGRRDVAFAGERHVEPDHAGGRRGQDHGRRLRRRAQRHGRQQRLAAQTHEGGSRIGVEDLDLADGHRRRNGVGQQQLVDQMDLAIACP